MGKLGPLTGRPNIACLRGFHFCRKIDLYPNEISLEAEIWSVDLLLSTEMIEDDRSGTANVSTGENQSTRLGWTNQVKMSKKSSFS